MPVKFPHRYHAMPKIIPARDFIYLRYLMRDISSGKRLNGKIIPNLFRKKKKMKKTISIVLFLLCGCFFFRGGCSSAGGTPTFYQHFVAATWASCDIPVIIYVHVSPPLDFYPFSLFYRLFPPKRWVTHAGSEHPHIPRLRFFPHTEQTPAASSMLIFFRRSSEVFFFSAIDFTSFGFLIFNHS